MSVNEENLGFLEPIFTKALEARQNGDNTRAIELFQNILRIEPRLPEPHLELAHIYLGLNQFETARIHSDQAIEYLENGGQWIDTISEDDILSLAYTIKGEIHRVEADQDEVVLGDVEIWKRMLLLSQACYRKALDLNPENEDAKYYSRHYHWLTGTKQAEIDQENQDQIETATETQLEIMDRLMNLSLIEDSSEE